MADDSQINDFKSTISGQVYTKEDGPKFTSVLERWNKFAILNEPRLVVCPNNVEDIRAAMKFAKQHSLPFVVRNGGHSIKSSQPGSLTLDMRNFKDVKVDKQTGQVVIGGGLYLGEIDNITAPIHVPVGIYIDTGATGLITHGGIGYQIRKRGYSVDNILGAKIVTVDGQLLTCNATENSDLFWAVRGAASSFGVIVELTLQGYEIPDVFVSMMAFPLTVENLKKIISTGENNMDNRDFNLYAIVSHSPDQQHKVVLAMAVYYGSTEEAERLIQPLTSANPHVIVPGGRMPFLKLQQLIGLQSFPAAYWYFTGGMIPQPTMPQAFIEELVNQWNQIPNDILGAVALEMRGGVGGSIPISTTAAPGHRSHSWDWMPIIGAQEDKKDQVPPLARRMRDALWQVSGSRGGLGAMNGNTQVQLVPEEIFGENYSRLRELKLKYDPDNFFVGLTNLLPH